MNADKGAGTWVGMWWKWTALAACAASVCSPALASEATSVAASAGATQAERPRLELSATQLPRFDAVDGYAASPRLDMSLVPPERGMGVLLGMGLPGAGTPRSSYSSASVDVGLQWRHTFESAHRVDVMAWRRVSPAAEAALAPHLEPTYGARVELDLTPARKTGFVAERGFIGFQLEGGGKISVRRKDGKPMIYYRTNF